MYNFIQQPQPDLIVQIQPSSGGDKKQTKEMAQQKRPIQKGTTHNIRQDSTRVKIFSLFSQVTVTNDEPLKN